MERDPVAWPVPGQSCPQACPATGQATTRPAIAVDGLTHRRRPGYTRLPSTPCAVRMNSPLRGALPGTLRAMFFSGAPANLSFNNALQPATSKPQLLGCRGEISTARSAALASCRRNQARPTAATQRQHQHSGVDQALALWISDPQGPSAFQPSQRWRVWITTRCRAGASARRAVTGRLSCRWEIPGLMCRRRSRCPGRESTGAKPPRRTRPAACRFHFGVRHNGPRTRVRLGMGDVHAATGQQELAAHRRHGIEHLDRQACLGQASAAIRPAGRHR